MTRFLALTAAFCLVFSAAVAGDTRTWSPTAYVQIQPHDDAVAGVLFVNDIAQTMSVEHFTLTLDGLTVEVRIDARADDIPDTMTVFPPPGYIAVPPKVTVREHEAGLIVIYEGGTS